MLGIDWGSDAVHASILTQDSPTPRSVRGTAAGHDLYAKGSFDSALYFYGPEKVHTRETRHPDHEVVPSKAFFSRRPRTRNRTVDAWLGGMEAEATWALVRLPMEAIAKAALVSAQRFCDGFNDIGSSRYHIVRIGLSHPAHWGHQQRTRYEELIRKVVPEALPSATPDVRISFHVESLALAHRVLMYPRSADGFAPSPSASVLVVLLEFGAFTMAGPRPKPHPGPRASG